MDATTPGNWRGAAHLVGRCPILATCHRQHARFLVWGVGSLDLVTGRAGGIEFPVKSKHWTPTGARRGMRGGRYGISARIRSTWVSIVIVCRSTVRQLLGFCIIYSQISY